MREKLIELIDAVLLYLPWGEVTPHTAADIADRIIDSGICLEEKQTQKPQTNADRIRAMSDEELEDFLITKEWVCDTYISCSECPLRGKKGCISILEWLKQPAEGE